MCVVTISLSRLAYTVPTFWNSFSEIVKGMARLKGKDGIRAGKNGFECRNQRL